MPPQKTKSGLVAKYGAKLANAVKQHAGDPTKVGRTRIPPGIVKGKARLTECRFGQVEAGKQNAGEYYFRAAGVAVEPESVIYNGSVVRVPGCQTSIMEMMCDTANSEGKVTTQDEHVSNVMNHLRLLGADTSTMGVEDLEATAKALEEADPPIHFWFSTSESKPQIDPKTGKPKVNPKTGQPYEPRIWENWLGTEGLTDYSPAPSANGTVDKTEGDGAGDGEAAGDDVEALLERANAEDGEAQERLKALAMEAGHAEDVCDSATSWQEVVDLINNPVDPNAVDETPEEPAEPEKGNVVHYCPIDPKTKKPVKKAIQCEIELVDKKAKTVNLKSLVNPKVKYLKIKWDAFQAAY